MRSRNPMLNKVIGSLHFWFLYFIKYHANKVAYLRAQGARIGDNCELFSNIGGFGSEPYLIQLGANVIIASGVLFITHDGATRLLRKIDSRWTRETGLYGTIKVGDNAFIGINSIIMPGVNIGANSAVGAGSVVTKDVPPNTIVAGNPAKIIRTVDEYREIAFRKAVILKCADDAKSRRISLEEIFWKN